MDVRRLTLTLPEDDREFVVVEFDTETVLVGLRWVDQSLGYAYAIVGGVMSGDAWSARIGGCPAEGPAEQTLCYVWRHGGKMGEKMARGFFTGGRSLKYLVHAGS